MSRLTHHGIASAMHSSRRDNTIATVLLVIVAILTAYMFGRTHEQAIQLQRLHEHNKETETPE